MILGKCYKEMTYEKFTENAILKKKSYKKVTKKRTIAY